MEEEPKKNTALRIKVIRELTWWITGIERYTVKELMSIANIPRMGLRTKLKELQVYNLIGITEERPKRVFLTEKGQEAMLIAHKWEKLVKI